MIGFQQMIPIVVVGALAYFLTPKVWDKLRKGTVKAAKDVKELGTELSSIATEDAKSEDNKTKN